MEIRECAEEEEEASWDLEGRVWAPFHQYAEGGAPSDYFRYLHLLAVEDEEIIGTIDACPFRWDGNPGTLQGWTEMVLASDEFRTDFRPEGEGLWAGAIGTSIDPRWKRGGLSKQLLGALRDRALEQGYLGMVAPVRPVARTRAPFLSLEEYAELRLPDGRHFDPWVRVHEDLGGRIVSLRENSASFRGTRSQWEDWTHMRLPSNGDVFIPGAAWCLRLRDDWGEVQEPSIWIVHASNE